MVQKSFINPFLLCKMQLSGGRMSNHPEAVIICFSRRHLIQFWMGQGSVFLKSLYFELSKWS